MKTPQAYTSSRTIAMRPSRTILWAVLLTILLTGLASLNTFAQANQANNLEKFLGTFNTLNVRFVQTEESTPPKVSYGTFKVKVPGKFIWQNDDESQQDIFANGENIYIYEKELQQVSIYNQQETLINTPAILISNPKSFQDNFTIEQQRDEGEGRWYGLSSKQQDSYYDYIEVYIANSKLQQLIILNRLNNMHTRIEFYYSDDSFNQPLADEAFEFLVPDGVDVLY